jgi:phospholipid/cholesterol/gamma-HCH transport system substrate-binding protein
MRENLRGALWRLAVYAIVCVIGAFGLIAVFAQLRFQSEKTYTAQFSNVSGLEGGNFVRIAGVEVGKVKNIAVQSDSTVLVEFTAADNVVLTEGTRAAIRFADLVGGRYIALEEGAGGVKRLHPGATIPLSRTEPALDLDALIGRASCRERVYACV